MSRSGGALAAALAEHRAALAAFVERARRVPPAQWERPAAPGKWSAGEITEHLRLALEALDRELRGDSAMRRVLPWWKRILLRRTVLPRILRTGRFPKGVAPREVRPSAPGIGQAEALRRLTEALGRFEAACGNRSAFGRRLTHPYFGGLALPRYYRLLALHTLHHREQLPRGPWKD
jgi:hypothetical protein